MTTRDPAVVVGGGLAGIAAAIALTDRGIPVTLLERRPFLGGRVFSFRDPDAGATIDNGQHVLVGACTRLLALLRRIGSPADGWIRQPRLAIPIADGSGRVETLSAPPLPSPLHAAAALAGYGHLGRGDRWAVARAARALTALDAGARAGLENVPLGDWLAGRGATLESIERFWEPLVRPALNVSVAEANLPLAAMLFERGILAGAGAGALLLPARGLSDTIGEPAGAALARTAVETRTGARAMELIESGGRVAGVVLAGGEAVRARSVVLAVPPEAADRLLPAGCRPAAGHAALGASPIVNAYLWYDRSVLPRSFLGTFDSPLQWVFDRARLLGAEEAGGQCVGVSLSAADEWIDLGKGEIADACDAAIAAVFPGRASARRLRSAVVKEPRATFRAGPGVAPLRPGAAGPLPGLALAGDWTDTGWPATMEGAVRSGESAAAHLLAAATT